MKARRDRCFNEIGEDRKKMRNRGQKNKAKGRKEGVGTW